MRRIRCLVIYKAPLMKKGQYPSIIDSERAFGNYLQIQGVEVSFWNYYLPNEHFLLNQDWDIIAIMSSTLSEVAFSSNQEKLRLRLNALTNLDALKIVFPQDEYYCSSDLEEIFLEWKIDVLVTINYEALEIIYPELSKNKTISFIHGRTVYFTEYFQNLRRKYYENSLTRKFHVSYRAHEPRLPNELARLKYQLGNRFENKLKSGGIRANLLLNTSGETIKGKKWIELLANSRCVLGGNGGSNVIFRNISIVNEILNFIENQARMPNKGELLQLGLQERDFVDLTAITPRNIETASIGVAQILVKGSYSEILKPGVDYLETDENFGNIEEIVDFVFDNKRIGEMTDSCWATVSQNQSLRLSNLLPAQDLWLKNLKFSNDDSYDALTRIVQKLQYWNGYSRYFLKKAENALEHRKGKILKLNNRYELRG